MTMLSLHQRNTLFEQATALRAEGHRAFSRGRWIKAREAYRQAGNLYAQIEARFQLIEVTQSYGDTFYREQQFDIAREIYERGLRLCDERDHRQLIFSLLNSLKRTAQYKNDLPAIGRYLLRLLAISNWGEWEHVNALNALAHLAAEMGQYEASRDYFARAAVLQPNNLFILRDWGALEAACGHLHEAASLSQLALLMALNNAETNPAELNSRSFWYTFEHLSISVQRIVDAAEKAAPRD